MDRKLAEGWAIIRVIGKWAEDGVPQQQRTEASESPRTVEYIHA